MDIHLFLLIFCGAWILFATVQDLRTREVANWLTFSLLAFVLAYRAFWASISSNASFFLWGLAGCAAFVGLAYAFYYGRVFAGGDAKLLMGVGTALPYHDGLGLAFWGGGFIALLFLTGAVYSLIYSTGIAWKRRRIFKRYFLSGIRNRRMRFVFALSIFLSVVLLALTLSVRSPYSISFVSGFYGIVGILFILALPFLYVYLQAVERIMAVRILPGDLSEGDWLAKDVLVNGQKIKANVHGLSAQEIRLLRRHGKEVIVKQGIPFVPAFLFAWIMVCAAATVPPVLSNLLLF